MRAGVGLKAEHCRSIVETLPSMGFLRSPCGELHGRWRASASLPTAVREHYPLSLHGVGLSIGADRPLDRDHLRRLKTLIERYEPALFSEHLAWSSHEAGFLNDLLPIPYTREALGRVTRHIDEVQEALGRQMLLENPSTYLAFAESSYSEVDFIAEVARRTGCALLLDVNNVHVASTNHEWNSFEYIDSFPLAHVREIHLAGHAREADEQGRALLIDTHDRAVDSLVWDLYGHAVDRIGPVPTLIEWDADVPDWMTLKAEAGRADAIMFKRSRETSGRCQGCVMVKPNRSYA